MKNYIQVFGICMALVGAVLFTGCMQEETIIPDAVSIEERGVTSIFSETSKATIYGLSPANQIIHFAAGPPVTIKSTIQMRGLRVGERMLAIDIRPATRQLYGVTNMHALYLINPSTGLATRISKFPFAPLMNGSMVGFDFHPKYDRIRIVTDSDQNLFINPSNGMVVSVDNALSPGSVGVNGIAYTTGTAEETSLYDISQRDGRLYNQLDSKGIMTAIGATGLTIAGEGGFDISRDNVRAFAVLYAYTTDAVGGTIGTPGMDDPSKPAYRLYNIDLITGQAQSMGRISPMIGIAIP